MPFVQMIRAERALINATIAVAHALQHYRALLEERGTT
jgi:hypothetical protein